MDREELELTCPHCGTQRLALDSFDHVIVVDRSRALASYRCPVCSGPLTTLVTISDSLAPYLDERLSLLAARYPKANFERFCSDKSLRHEDAYLDRFREELEAVFGVDDVISQSDNPNRKKSDN